MRTVKQIDRSHGSSKKNGLKLKDGKIENPSVKKDNRVEASLMKFTSASQTYFSSLMAMEGFGKVDFSLLEDYKDYIHSKIHPGISSLLGMSFTESQKYAHFFEKISLNIATTTIFMVNDSDLRNQAYFIAEWFVREVKSSVEEDFDFPYLVQSEKAQKISAEILNVEIPIRILTDIQTDPTISQFIVDTYMGEMSESLFISRVCKFMRDGALWASKKVHFSKDLTDADVSSTYFIMMESSRNLMFRSLSYARVQVIKEFNEKGVDAFPHRDEGYLIHKALPVFKKYFSQTVMNSFMLKD